MEFRKYGNLRSTQQIKLDWKINLNDMERKNDIIQKSIYYR